MITYEFLLDQVQEFLGVPPGSFYNISNRLDALRSVEQDMLLATHGLDFPVTITVNPLVDSSVTGWLPTGFAGFGSVPVTWDGAGIEVVSPRRMNVRVPGRDQAQRGNPRFIVKVGQEYRWWPVPDKLGEFSFSYVPKVAPLGDLSDAPFHGDEVLNPHAIGLAYKVAARASAASAPQLAQYYEQLYTKEERAMRHKARSSVQMSAQYYPAVTMRGIHASAD